MAVKQSLCFVTGNFPCQEASRYTKPPSTIHSLLYTPPHPPTTSYLVLNPLPLTGELTLFVPLKGPQSKQRGNIASFQDPATASCTYPPPVPQRHGGGGNSGAQTMDSGEGICILMQSPGPMLHYKFKFLECQEPPSNPGIIPFTLSQPC